MRIINVLIAEDEKLIRAGICTLVENFFAARSDLGYRIIQSNNGKDAYRKCNDEYVDILITDIKMPIMSGVSLAKKLLLEQPSIHILAISGFNDYDFVRDMLKMGAYDYLLKPIDEEQFKQAMEYFIANLAAPWGKSNALFTEQRLVKYMLLQSHGYQEEFDAFLKTNQLQEDTICDVIFIKEDATQEEEMHQCYGGIKNYCASFPRFYCLLGELSAWVLVLLHQAAAEDFLAQAVKTIKEHKMTILKTYNSISINDVKHLHLKLEEMFYDMPRQEGECLEIDELWGKLDAVMLGNEPFSKAEEIVKQWIYRYQNLHLPLADIKKDVTEYMYRLMSKEMDYIEFVSKIKFTKYDYAAHFNSAASLTDLHQRLIQTFFHLYTRNQKRSDAGNEFVISKAKQYIKERYAEDLQLNNLAAHVHLHPNYFSSLFREKTGVTFRDYLRSQRIEAAKQVLLEENLPISEVAQRVGYNDSAHFFRAFKEVTGVTPRKFTLGHK